MRSEPDAVVERYARRRVAGLDDRYAAWRPEVWQTLHERQRVLLDLMRRHGATDLAALRLTEVGCGSGGNLLELLRLGFRPEHLIGLELLPERQAQARQMLPAATEVRLGDAVQADIAAGSQDLVLQSTVFSSLLDPAFQETLAAAMWAWLKPGGAIVWYDMAFDNPHNPDVRGLPAARIRALFAHGRADIRRVTLAPPLARRICRWHPGFYTLLNRVPQLRTHRLAWIEKPA